MKQSVSFHQFERAFIDMDRRDNFSYEGLKALFEYLERYEEEMGEDMELDVIALCCEFQEINDDEEAYKEYIGDEAHLQELVIQELCCSVLVREG